LICESYYLTIHEKDIFSKSGKKTQGATFVFILCMSRLTGYHMYSIFEVSWHDVRVLVGFLSHFNGLPHVFYIWNFVVWRERFGGFSQSLQTNTIILPSNKPRPFRHRCHLWFTYQRTIQCHIIWGTTPLNTQYWKWCLPWRRTQTLPERALLSLITYW